MGGDKFRRVRGGERQRLSAGGWNAAMKAAEAAERRHAGATNLRDLFRNSTIVKLQNTTGAARARFDVVAAAGSVISPVDSVAGFQSKLWLNGVAFAHAPPFGFASSNLNRVAVLLEPIPSYESGWAVVDGLAICQVTITNLEHTHASPTVGVYNKLTSGYSGHVQLISRQFSGSVPQDAWCVVRLGPDTSPRTRWLKLTEPWKPRGVTNVWWDLRGNPCADMFGASADTSTTLDLKLLQPPAAIAYWKTPNAQAGDVVEFYADGNGNLIARADWIWDDPPGTKKLWNTTPPRGWYPVDGTHTEDGGSLADLRNKYLRIGGWTDGATTWPTTTGGQDSLSINDHAAGETGQVNHTTQGVAAGFDATVASPPDNTDFLNHAHIHTTPAHQHGGTGATRNGADTASEWPLTPAFASFMLIERVDDSGTW